MSEHYSPEARQVLALAQEQAQGLGHDYVGTEHLLLGLLAQEGDGTAQILGSLGVTTTRVQAEVERVIGRGERRAGGEIPFTPAAERALERSQREVEALGLAATTPRQLLLGLTDERDGLAARILRRLDVSPEQVRSAVSQQG